MTTHQMAACPQMHELLHMTNLLELEHPSTDEKGAFLALVGCCEGFWVDETDIKRLAVLDLRQGLLELQFLCSKWITMDSDVYNRLLLCSENEVNPFRKVPVPTKKTLKEISDAMTWRSDINRFPKMEEV